MNTQEHIREVWGTANDEPPLDLIFAQHNLQKLSLASPHNYAHLLECIAHQLGNAEQILVRNADRPGIGRYFSEIAAARAMLRRARH